MRRCRRFSVVSASFFRDRVSSASPRFKFKSRRRVVPLTLSLQDDGAATASRALRYYFNIILPPRISLSQPPPFRVSIPPRRRSDDILISSSYRSRSYNHGDNIIKTVKTTTHRRWSAVIFVFLPRLILRTNRKPRFTRHDDGIITVIIDVLYFPLTAELSSYTRDGAKICIHRQTIR